MDFAEPPRSPRTPASVFTSLPDTIMDAIKKKMQAMKVRKRPFIAGTLVMGGNSKICIFCKTTTPPSFRLCLHIESCCVHLSSLLPNNAVVPYTKLDGINWLMKVSVCLGFVPKNAINTLIRLIPSLARWQRPFSIRVGALWVLAINWRDKTFFHQLGPTGPSWS